MYLEFSNNKKYMEDLAENVNYVALLKNCLYSVLNILIYICYNTVIKQAFL